MCRMFNTLFWIPRSAYLDFSVLKTMKYFLQKPPGHMYFYRELFDLQRGLKCPFFSLCFSFPGARLGTFCVDCTSASDAADGLALGAAAGLCLLRPCIPHHPRPCSSWLGENDDEVQVKSVSKAWRDFKPDFPRAYPCATKTALCPELWSWASAILMVQAFTS